MRMYDVITKKKAGEPLTDAEIAFFVTGFTNGDIPDYQAAALLMAICLRGMDSRETAALTVAMAQSGDTADLSGLGVTVDKHSTGGVGDKTTLAVAPILAATGATVAKMSGRGLGHTGGTVDKLEAIPGFRSALPREEFMDIARRVGLVVAGQSGNLAPADKKLYALRDVTATVDSVPLIAASVMSKKLAAGAAHILLDVKVGAGAFMKTPQDAAALAQAMVDIGERAGRKTAAQITPMDEPLGRAVGNAIEVAEAVAVLRGQAPEDLTRVCKALAVGLLTLSGLCAPAVAGRRVDEAIQSGAALDKLARMVAAQGGDASYVYAPEKFPKAAYARELKAAGGGVVTALNALTVGEAACLLGAGREKSTDKIDAAAGVWIAKKVGERVQAGEPLAVLYAEDPAKLERGAARLSAAWRLE